MQTDWGGEYEKLNSFFKKIGISHHVSCPHAHQQNGSAERKHRHIVEVALALLANACMPLKFWDEAVITATYLINRTPSRVIKYITPLEQLFQQKPNYSLLRVFGCVCWPNLRPYNNHKLQFRSKQCVFLGYSSLHKGFKCLDIPTGRVYVSRDVIFDENIFPFSTLHSNAGARLRSEIALLSSSLLPYGHDPGGENRSDHVFNTDEISGDDSAAQNSTGNDLDNDPGTHGGVDAAAVHEEAENEEEPSLESQHFGSNEDEQESVSAASPACSPVHVQELTPVGQVQMEVPLRRHITWTQDRLRRQTLMLLLNDRRLGSRVAYGRRRYIQTVQLNGGVLLLVMNLTT